jgi:LacI family transcriptional regulator
MSAMPVTRTAIARRAGVHRSTVSRVLSGEAALARIPQATVARVQAAARELGWSSAPVRRTLAPPVIALVADHRFDFHNTAFEQLIPGLVEVFARKGIDVRLVQVREPEDWAQRGLALEVRGVVLLSTMAGIVDQLIPQFGVPVVAFNPAAELPSVDQVLLDDVHGMVQLVDHVVALGHRHLTLIEHDTMDHRWSQDLRRQGAMERCAEHGVRLTVLSVDARNLHRQPEVVVDHLSSEARPTALLCYSNHGVAEIARLLLNRGWAVPGQISLACGLGAHYLQVLQVPVTAVDLDAVQIATALARLLHQRLSGDPAPPQRVLVPPKLVVRASTGPAPRR